MPLGSSVIQEGLRLKLILLHIERRLGVRCFRRVWEKSWDTAGLETTQCPQVVIPGLAAENEWKDKIDQSTTNESINIQKFSFSYLTLTGIKLIFWTTVVNCCNTAEFFLLVISGFCWEHDDHIGMLWGCVPFSVRIHCMY